MAEDGGNVSHKGDANFHKVIIIGGGMAGLSAANHLKKNGIEDFIILEARSRIGGRIVSIPLKDHRVELGANWIHGVLGNPVFEMAMSHGLVNIINNPKPHKVIAATENGKQVPFGILHEIYEAYICFLRRCEEYFLCQYLPPADIQSVGEHINLEAAIYLDRMPSSEEKNLRRLIFDCLLKRETCISGCHTMNEIDLLELGSYTELQGGNIQLPSGYSSILEPMTKNIPTEKILLKKPVNNIIWKSGTENEDGNESDDSDKTVIEDLSKAPSVQKAEEISTSSSNPSRKHIEVICEDNQKFECDHVICTLPLGVLKARANTMFLPPLPKYKIEAIDKLLFGTVDKIFLEYNEPFLNPNITEILLLWDEAPSNDVNIEDSWYKKIYSFSKVSETLLLGWISGQEADYMETLPSDVVASTCTKILRQFLNDKSIPEPVTCVCTSWKNQPYTRGSYTAIAVGACQADIEALAQPLYASSKQKKPVVVFAGEHTHTNFYSTVHGAYLTGRTAAQHLLDEGRRQLVLECNDTGDLSGWLQSLSLER